MEIHAVSQPEERAEYAGQSLWIIEVHKFAEEAKIETLQTFRELYNWSVGDNRTDFWEDMWNASGLIYEGSYSKVCVSECAISI